MKKLVTFFALLFFITIFAQAPQGFNYQATVRNNAGALIVNQNVYFKFNITQGSSTSLPVFTETHYVPTDELGQVNLVIGQGTASLGTFATIDWSLGNYYLGIELNTGSGYTAMGTTQLLSVPYALYAQNAGNATTPTIPSLASVLAENNSANNLVITNVANPINNQDAATKSYVDTQITANALPNGTSIGDLLSWNGSSWQPIANNNAFGGRTTIYLSGNITNAQAAQQIAQQVGPNTEKIIISRTTGLTQINISGVTNLISFEVSGNASLQSVIVNDLTEVGFIKFSDNPSLEAVSFPNLLKIYGIADGSYSSNSFVIGDSPNLNFLNLPLLQEINKDLHIFYGNFTQLLLPNLTKGDISVSSNINLNQVNLNSFQEGKINITGSQLVTISLPSLVRCQSLNLEDSSLSSSTVNSLLNQFLNILPSSGKYLNLSFQTPSAPPTGQGLIDKQTLIDNGNNVSTD